MPKKRIKLLNETINEKDNKTLITTSKNPINNRECPIVFSFSNFQKESVKCKGFNNFYPTRLDAINAAKDFLESIKILSTYTPKQLFEYAAKEQFHYNEFDEEDPISRIENVLINGYNMNSEKVRQFEGLYFEFQFSDGKRAIGTKIDENIFSILFLDPNHFICKESARDTKRKEQYLIPAIFGGWDNSTRKLSEVSKDDLLRMIIDDIQKGIYTDINMLSKDLSEILNMK